MSKQAKWKKKLGSRLMEHVFDTTENGTLAEVKRNIAHLNETKVVCFECREIERKLDTITTTTTTNRSK